MPSQEKRPATLTVQDRQDLVRITTTGVHGASQIIRARVLLALDTSVGAVDAKEVIATRLGVSGETLRRVAKRLPIPAAMLGPPSRASSAALRVRRCNASRLTQPGQTAVTSHYGEK